jgi:hypothetical protein
VDNIEVRIEGNKMILEIDLDHEGSSTGNGNVKTATTDGWMKVPDHPGMSLNCVVTKSMRLRRSA